LIVRAETIHKNVIEVRESEIKVYDKNAYIPFTNKFKDGTKVVVLVIRDKDGTKK